MRTSVKQPNHLISVLFWIENVFEMFQALVFVFRIDQKEAQNSSTCLRI